MPLPQKPVRRGSRLSLAVAISLIAHALVLPFVARDANFHMPKHPVRQVVSLLSTARSQLQGVRAGPNTVSDAQQVPNLPPSVRRRDCFGPSTACMSS